MPVFPFQKLYLHSTPRGLLRERFINCIMWLLQVRMLDVLEDFCRARSHTFERLDGGITGARRQSAIGTVTNA